MKRWTPRLTAARSSRSDVRNPVVALSAVEQLRSLDPISRASLRAILLSIRMDAKDRAEKCWRKHKAPMACYWKVVSVYAGHIARVLR